MKPTVEGERPFKKMKFGDSGQSSDHLLSGNLSPNSCGLSNQDIDMLIGNKIVDWRVPPDDLAALAGDFLLKDLGGQPPAAAEVSQALCMKPRSGDYSQSSDRLSVGNGSQSLTKQEIDMLIGHKRIVHLKAKYSQLQKLAHGPFGLTFAGQRRADDLPVVIQYIPKAKVVRLPVRLNGQRYQIPIEVVLMHKAAGGLEPLGRSATLSLFDWYDLDKVLALVIERPDFTENLQLYMINNFIDERKAKIIMRQLVEAAIDFQRKGVFHRDLKSENILIDFASENLRVRITGFGRGCIYRNIRYYHLMGKPANVPPEFLKRGEYTAGAATVWQLGTILFEMLDGLRHFTTQMFLNKELQLKKNVTSDCYNLLMRCLSVKPEDRITLKEILIHPWLL